MQGSIRLLIRRAVAALTFGDREPMFNLGEPNPLLGEFVPNSLTGDVSCEFNNDWSCV